MHTASAKTVLIVEDEIALADVLEEYLRASSFAVDRLADGEAVVAHVRAHPPDLMLLDLMLPGRDGLDICRELRGFTTLPIIMITARVEEIDRLLGLELGADDYVCKPFAPREVVARVKAQLRRVDMLTHPRQEMQQQTLYLDSDRYEARMDGQALRLTAVEFRLLDTLCRHPGRVLPA
jgi:two-component system response regulator BaeR